LPGFTIGYVSENLQKEAYNQALSRVNTKNPPSMDKIFNYSVTQKLVSELDGKGWKPNRQ
jgi:hypothetical protein